MTSEQLNFIYTWVLVFGRAIQRDPARNAFEVIVDDMWRSSDSGGYGGFEMIYPEDTAERLSQ